MKETIALDLNSTNRIRLIEFWQEYAPVIANTLFQQHKRRLYIWTSPDGQYQNQIDYIICSQRWRSSIQSAKTILGADCGSDHVLLIAKYRLQLKKVGKTTRPFEYDLIKSLMIIQWKWQTDSRIRSGRRNAWRTMDWGSWHCTWGRDQGHPREKEMQKVKKVFRWGLTKIWEKKRS